MKNLAGVIDADSFVQMELKRAGIPIATVANNPDHEVDSCHVGVLGLGEFVFHRAWSYWVVKGMVPYEFAKELYEHPVGKTDIRVGGHCGCPSPDTYGTKWLSRQTGKELCNLRERDACQQIISAGGHAAELVAESMNKYEFVEDPSAVGEGFVDTYHIDSELGLYVFAETLKRLAHAAAGPGTFE